MRRRERWITQRTATSAGWVEAFEPDPGPDARRGVEPDLALVTLCERHPVFRGEYGCRLCEG